MLERRRASFVGSEATFVLVEVKETSEKVRCAGPASGPCHGSFSPVLVEVVLLLL